MAQADQTVQNATFPTVRADINNNLAALFSANSGNTAPSVTVAFQDWIDTSGVDPVWKKRNAANSAWITIATFTGSDLSLGEIDPGTVQFFAGSTAPTGWLKANGALLSRSTYAALFAAIGTTYGLGDGSTTFALPDMRGEFPRGWDDGRGVDSGRAFGTAQLDALQNHTHLGNGLISLGGTQILNNFGQAGRNDQPTGLVSAGYRSAAETRPRNIALLALIKF